MPNQDITSEYKQFKEYITETASKFSEKQLKKILQVIVTIILRNKGELTDL